jgi:hypothetical protein
MGEKTAREWRAVDSGTAFRAPERPRNSQVLIAVVSLVRRGFWITVESVPVSKTRHASYLIIISWWCSAVAELGPDPALVAAKQREKESKLREAAQARKRSTWVPT